MYCTGPYDTRMLTEASQLTWFHVAEGRIPMQMEAMYSLYLLFMTLI